MTITLHEVPASHPDVAGLPSVRHIVARVAVSLVTAVVVPALLFASTMLVFSVFAAMVVALAWVCAAIAWRAGTGREVSGLLVLTGGVMVVKTAISLATGNTFIYFVQPVVVDAAVAVAFLVSLRSARPLVARLAPDFCPLAAEIAGCARIRRLFRGLTLMWGLVVLAKGGVTLWLLLTLSTVDFVLVKSGIIVTMTAVAVTATVLWSVGVCRREGLLGAGRGDRSSASV